MGAPTYTVPTANSPTSVEEPKIITALAEIKTILNGNVDGDNLGTGVVDNAAIADNSVSLAKMMADSVNAAKVVDGSLGNAEISASAAIAFAKLAALASGQIVAGNAGVPTARTLGGAATIDASGNLALAVPYAQQGFDTNLTGGGGFADINGLSMTPAAGLYLLASKIVVNSGISTGLGLVVMRMKKNASAIDVSAFEGAATGTDYISPVCLTVASLNGSDVVSVEASAAANNTCVVQASNGGWLVGVRIS